MKKNTSFLISSIVLICTLLSLSSCRFHEYREKAELFDQQQKALEEQQNNILKEQQRIENHDNPIIDKLVEYEETMQEMKTNVLNKIEPFYENVERYNGNRYLTQKYYFDIIHDVEDYREAALEACKLSKKLWMEGAEEYTEAYADEYCIADELYNKIHEYYNGW